MTETTASLPQPTTPAGARAGLKTLLGRRQLREVGYLVLGLPAGVLAFSWVVTGMSTVPWLALLVIGLPGVLVFAAGNRWLCGLERRRAQMVLGTPIPAVYRPAAPGAGLMRRVGAALTDAQTWKDLAWLALCGPVGLAGFVLTVSAWGAVLGMIAMPLWYWPLADTADPVDYGLFQVTSLPIALGVTAIGIALVPLAGWLVHI
jgi:hypothetical protein